MHICPITKKMLPFMISVCILGTIEDAYIVPVSITYEAAEGDFVAKQLDVCFMYIFYELYIN